MSIKMNKIIQGDCLEKLKELESDSVDCIVTDPPYGYSFMGKDWDKAVPSVEVWKECLRVLKPGAFAFIMSAPRQDVLSQMIVRVTEAGFDTDYTSLYWTYASGFPKAMNIGKAVDKRMGAKRERIKSATLNAWRETEGRNDRPSGTTPDSNPITIEAKLLDGSYGGFQPKPAVEVIIVAMKPLSEKTYVDQALNNGKGVTWLDDARIPTNPEVDDKRLGGNGSWDTSKTAEEIYEGGYTGERISSSPLGRFPANLLVSDDVLNDGVERKSGNLSSGHKRGTGINFGGGGIIRGNYGGDSGSYSRYFSLDAWAKTLPFLICPKASKSEKNRGLEGFEKKKRPPSMQTANGTSGEPSKGMERFATQSVANNHPTVKPLKLMSYLITLGSREGDTILDPFAGSCTTCVAAKELKRNYIGIEREGEYVKICEARLEAVPNTLFQ